MSKHDKRIRSSLFLRIACLFFTVFIGRLFYEGDFSTMKTIHVTREEKYYPEELSMLNKYKQLGKPSAIHKVIAPPTDFHKMILDELFFLREPIENYTCDSNDFYEPYDDFFALPLDDVLKNYELSLVHEDLILKDMQAAYEKYDV